MTYAENIEVLKNSLEDGDRVQLVLKDKDGFPKRTLFLTFQNVEGTHFYFEESQKPVAQNKIFSMKRFNMC